jgi:hypothetical protein
LQGVTSVSIDYGSGATWQDDRVRAYVESPGDITGWVGFDLSVIPVRAHVLSLDFILHHQVGYSNPYGGPITAVEYSSAWQWTRTSATQANLPRTALVSGKTSTFAVGDFNDFSVEVTLHDWSTDLSNRWLTLGVTNLMQSYSYVYFDGTDDALVAPQLDITTCE